MDEPLSAPLSATINITESCNLDCSYCYARIAQTGVNMPAEMAVGLAKNLEAKGVWRLVIGGGEPFLHPEIIFILSEILETGISIGIVTNGIPIRKHYDDVLDLSRIHGRRLNLQISIDGPTPEIHDRNRDQGQAVFAIVERLAADGVRLQLATVVTRHNVETADQVIDVFYPGVKNYHYMNLMPSRKLLLERAELWPEPEEVQDLWARCRQRMKQLLDIHVSLPDCLREVAAGATMDCPGCTAGFTRMDINANGDVVACSMAHNSVMGNLFEMGLEEIWFSETAARIRAVEHPLCHVPLYQIGQ